MTIAYMAQFVLLSCPDSSQKRLPVAFLRDGHREVVGHLRRDDARSTHQVEGTIDVLKSTAVE